eukprot:1170641-Pyramimonas_sp.AAC.1
MDSRKEDGTTSYMEREHRRRRGRTHDERGGRGGHSGRKMQCATEGIGRAGRGGSKSNGNR